MVQPPFMSWGSTCLRCQIPLEPDYQAPSSMGRAFLWLSRGAARWRWCRRCMWRGLALFAHSSRESSPASYRGG